MKNAVPSIFTWSDQNDEVSQRSVKARIRGDKTTKSFAGPLDMETENASGTFEAMTVSKNNPQEADLDGKVQDRDLVAEICDLRQRLSLSKFGLERFASSDDDIFFYTVFQSYNALIAFWNIVNHAPSLCLAGTEHVAKRTEILLTLRFLTYKARQKKSNENEKYSPLISLDVSYKSSSWIIGA